MIRSNQGGPEILYVMKIIYGFLCSIGFLISIAEDEAWNRQ